MARLDLRHKGELVSVTAECTHAPSTDPRFENTCRKCGRDMAEMGLLRDVDKERAIVRRCAKRPEVADALFDYSASRADEGPWRDCAQRNWRRREMATSKGRAVILRIDGADRPVWRADGHGEWGLAGPDLSAFYKAAFGWLHAPASGFDQLRLG